MTTEEIILCIILTIFFAAMVWLYISDGIATRRREDAIEKRRLDNLIDKYRP